VLLNFPATCNPPCGADLGTAAEALDADVDEDEEVDTDSPTQMPPNANVNESANVVVVGRQRDLGRRRKRHELHRRFGIEMARCQKQELRLGGRKSHRQPLQPHPGASQLSRHLPSRLQPRSVESRNRDDQRTRRATGREKGDQHAILECIGPRKSNVHRCKNNCVLFHRKKFPSQNNYREIRYYSQWY
jgi:hypothetical protein